MFKSSCSALYCSLLRVLHFVHFSLNDGRSWKYHSAVWPLCQFRGKKKIAAGIPVITNFLLKKEWWIIWKARFLSRSAEGADVYKEKILQRSKAKRSGSIREHSRSKMVWSCLDFDKHDQNVSTLSYYSMSKCMCVCVCGDYFTCKHRTCCASLLLLVSTCKHCTASILHSAQVDRAIMLKAHLPNIFLPKMASRSGRSLNQRVLISSSIDWWSLVIYQFISVPNELWVLSCPEENNHKTAQAP